VSYVIDASVAAKLFITEDYTEKATEIMEAHTGGTLAVLAPTLIVYELGNIFYKHPQITPRRAYEFITRFLDLQIDMINVYSDTELLKEAFNISKNKDVTFYDASYIALAEKTKTKLVTADEKIQNKAPNTTVLIRDFKT
jgi:predicted nucleic acid-binding protein